MLIYTVYHSLELTETHLAKHAQCGEVEAVHNHPGFLQQAGGGKHTMRDHPLIPSRPFLESARVVAMGTADAAIDRG